MSACSLTVQVRGNSLLATGALLLAMATGANAMPPPVPEDCAQTDSGDRIKCKFGNLIAQQQTTADMISSLPLLPPGQTEGLKKQVSRTNRTHGRTPPVNFKQLTKKQELTCQILEIVGDGIGDDDGICKANEQCVEVIDDQIGDNDGICQPRNGNKREVCVEICDSEAINADADNFDDDPSRDSTGRDLEESIDDMTGQYIEMNEALDQEMQNGTFAALALTGTGACDVAIRARASTTLLATLGGGANGARVGADVAERFCDQTAFGVNTAAVCAVIEGVAGAAGIIANAFLFEDAAIDSDTIDATLECAMSMNTSVDELKLAAGDTQAQISALGTQISGVKQEVFTVQQQLIQVQQQLDTTLQLLNTPQGIREDFPTN